MVRRHAELKALGVAPDVASAERMTGMGHCTKSLRDSPLRRALNWERVNQLREE